MCVYILDLFRITFCYTQRARLEPFSSSMTNQLEVIQATVFNIWILPAEKVLGGLSGTAAWLSAGLPEKCPKPL